MADEINYRDVLADLQKKRAELDAAIVAVRHLLNLGNDQSSNHNAPPHTQLHRQAGQHRAKLTSEQIAQIKACHAHGKSQGEIAQECGVSRGTVYNVLSGRRDKKPA
jgi:DNA-binding NarL/FixJ family response regulator